MSKKVPLTYNTPTTDRKIVEIVKWTALKWDKQTARKYSAMLKQTIKSVAEGITPTRINREFSTRFSYCTAKRHYIFFEHQKDKLIVATIFHTAMSVKDRMAEEMPVIGREINEIEN
jgi:plasmid stabilization system protein ParE